jgi:hypothetical protein
MSNGATEAGLTCNTTNLKRTGLETYLVTFFFYYNVKTTDELFSEMRKSQSVPLSRLEALDIKKLFKAFFSLN